MTKSSLTAISYTHQANKGALAIKNYLLYKFTQKEVDNFYALLNIFEKVIPVFPQLYPKSSNKNIHRAVLSKQLSVFYRVSKTKITVIAILDNRMDSANWP